MAKGKRAGARRRARPRPALVALALLATIAVIGWGLLVLAAIDFGAAARGGESGAWGLLALAAVGAAAALFAALLIIARIARAVGLTARRD